MAEELQTFALDAIAHIDSAYHDAEKFRRQRDAFVRKLAELEEDVNAAFATTADQPEVRKLALAMATDGDVENVKQQARRDLEEQLRRAEIIARSKATA